MHKKVVKQLKETKKKMQDQAVEIERLKNSAKSGKDADDKLADVHTTHIKKLEEQVKKLRDELKNKEKEFTDYRKKVIKDDKQARQTKGDWEQTERKYKQEIASLNAEIKSLQSTQKSLENNVNTIKDASSKALDIKLAAFQDKEKQWKAEKEKLIKQKDELKKLKLSISSLELELEKKDNKISSSKKDLSKSQNEVDKLKNAIKLLEDQLNQLKNSNDAAKKTKIEVDKIKAEKENEIAILKEKLTAKEKELNDNKKFYDNKLNDIQQSSAAELDALKTNNNNAVNQHIEKLKKDIAAKDDDILLKIDSLNKLKQCISEEKGKNDGLTTQLGAANDQLNSANTSNTDLSQKFQDLNDKFILITNNFNDLKTSSDLTNNDNNNKITKLTNDLTILRDKSVLDNKDNDDKINGLDKQISDLTQSVNDKNDANIKLTEQLNEKQQQLDDNKLTQNDLNNQVSGLNDQLAAERATLALKIKENDDAINKLNIEIEEKINNRDNKINDLTDKLTTTEHDLNAKILEFSNSQATISSLEIDLNAFKQKLINEKKNNADTVAIYVRKEERIHKSCKTLFTKFTAIRSEMKQVQSAQIRQIEEVTKFFGDFGPLLAKVFQFNQTMIDDLLVKYKRELSLRRKYFNMVQDLRGNIRVFCRVRPILPFEKKKGMGSCMKFPQEGQLIIKDDKGKNNTFEFDQVYEPSTSQEQVSEDATEYIQSVMDGYNVSIFAYGQTGSGKTFTMEGPKTNPGVNLRALKHLFKIAAERSPQFQYKIKVSVFEIYNEKINDLIVGAEDALDAKNNKKKKKNKKKPTKPVKKDKNARFKIRHLPDGSVQVLGLTTVAVRTDSDILVLNKIAKSNRSAASTDMNAHSSRSHMLLVVDVAGINIPANIKYFGKLYLVDLAGSERVKKSGATGQALKEAQNINKSLSALGDVMQALQKKDNFIPYRNSTLTDLMANALGGNAKTIMFINCCPTDAHAFETMSSLKFAKRVGKVELGQAKKNTSKK